MVEAAGVGLFHTLWFLQLADSKKENMYSKFYFAGVIVRASYTENRAKFEEMRPVTKGSYTRPAGSAERYSLSALDRECTLCTIPVHTTVSHLSIILKYARKEEGR
jgi:hypothetical protein